MDVPVFKSIWIFACVAAAVVLTSGQAYAAPSASSAQVDVIPAPARVEFRKGVFAIRDGTVISIPRDPGAARIARYFADLMDRTCHVHLKIVERSNETPPEDAIVFRFVGATRRDPKGEDYALDVAPGRIVAESPDAGGLFYAAVTLWQLSTATGAAGKEGISIQALDLTDKPRFHWRGLMLDSARHFQPPQFVMQLIDWMALHKLNVLHWHLTDDQGWRLEIKKYPRLTEVGAWRVPAGAAAAADIDPATGHPRLYGGFYTQDEVRRIVAYAAERNITIVPELDMPGHATAAIAAYPQLGVTDHPPTAPGSDWGIYENVYNVDDSTFAFLDDVLDEVMALFPGEYVHVGGDEAVKNQWQASAKIQARMRALHIADEDGLQSYFIQRLEKYLNAHGRRMIGWDETLEGGIAKNATIMSWRGIDGAVKAVQAGHDAILSPSPTLYFDHRQGAGSDEPPGRGQVISLHDVYDFNPMPSGITAAEGHHVLGLQANVWTEHIRTEERVEYMTFPRAAAVAEIGWSGPEKHDWNDFVRRLLAQFARYKAVGLTYSDDALHPQVGQLGPFDRHASQDLKTCSNKAVLSLEDDAPLQGRRAVFLVDILNPCWILPHADLSHAPKLQVAVGQVPFNFQIGKDRDGIRLATPQTPSGELEVHLDSCEGKRLAFGSLAPAAGNTAVTRLPAIELPQVSGRHDLCFRFTQSTLDPLWALDWVQLRE